MKTERYKIPRYKLKLVRDGVASYSADKIDHFDSAVEIAKAMLADSECERVAAIYLNGANVPIGASIIAMGGASRCALTPADVFRGAIVVGATAIIMAHNHPSGNPTPSAEDLAMTFKVLEAGKLLGVFLLDHVIIARDVGRGVTSATLRDYMVF